MDASAAVSSPPSNSEKAKDEQTADHRWEPGPDLKQPSWLQCRISILGHALRFHLVQISIMVFALALLIDLVLRWDELRPPLHLQYSLQMIKEVLRNIAAVLLSSPMFFQNGNIPSSASPSTWIGWWINVQSLLGGGTLLVALFVWYGEIREEWENRLPKRMSVFFLYQGLPTIICRYVLLADEGDLRAWAQQVAGQAAQVPYLRFYPDIKAEIPSKAVWIDKKICRHYVVCFKLTDNNPDLRKYLGYEFSWDEIPGKDSGRFVEFISQKFGIDWIKNAQIEKIDNGETIKISTEKNSLSLKHKDKMAVVLEIDDRGTYEFILKTKNGKPHISYPRMCCYQNMATGYKVFPVPLDELHREVSASVFPFKWPESSNEI